MVKVKICGITNLEDAKKAVKLGADFLGFIFYRKSPRFIRPIKAKDIIKKLPKNLMFVGVFVNEKEDKIRWIAKDCRLNILQFHGDETAKFCRRFKKYKIIKALRIKDKNALRKISNFNAIDFFLLDTYNPKLYGGSGKKFNWDILKRKRFKKPIFLSGGITPKNVRKAIREVRPYGIDVASGIEKSAGKKDHRKMQQLFKAIHSLNLS